MTYEEFYKGHNDYSFGLGCIGGELLSEGGASEPDYMGCWPL